MARRARNPRGQGDRLRAVLLDAATELLAEKQSVEEISVRAVTSRAGVSPTALYLHFESKEQLTEAVKQRCFGELGERLREAEAGDAGDPRAQLRALGHAYMRFAREQPGHYAVLFHTRFPQAGEAHSSDRGPGKGMEVFEILVGAVRRCLTETPDDAFEASVLLWMNLHGRASAASAMPTFPFPDEGRYLELLVRAVIGPEESR
jgi:AcrR family transcriptional regulator